MQTKSTAPAQTEQAPDINVRELLQKGLALHQKGHFAQAKLVYEAILTQQPKHFDALHLLGLVYFQTGNSVMAEELIAKALQIAPKNPAALSNHGSALMSLKRLDQALASYDKAVALKPDFANAHHNRGNALKELKRLDEALDSYDQAIRLKPDYAEAYNNQGTTFAELKRQDEALNSYNKALRIKLDYAGAYHNRGNALKELKRLDEALNDYDAAIRIKPDYVEAYSSQGNALAELKRLDEAIKSYDQAIRLEPDFAEAHYNRGIALAKLKRLDEAVKSFDEVLRIKPDYAEAYYNRGNALKELKRLDEAIKSYDEALRINPNHAGAYGIRGNALAELKRLDEAIKSYDEAIRLKPDFAEAYNDRGTALAKFKRLEEAIKSYDQAIRIKPDFAEAYNNKGNALAELKRPDEALNSYKEALRIKPSYEFLFGTTLHAQLKICDWTELPRQLQQLETLLRAQRWVTTPFPLLSLIDQPELHLLASKVYTEKKNPVSYALGDLVKREPDAKIRIGYYSADFHDHATTHLMAELFEAHDSNRFELFGFSFGPRKIDEMRQRISGSFKQFIDVSDRSDLELAKLSRELGIDIAVDLKGFTQDSRTGIFALRCAPIQVNYLGYPGTMGASYIDYIVADPILIPEESQHHYTEKIVYMPHSYQVNDSKRKISDRTFTRQELGLPEEGFVFCCFNNNYKILPATFDSWMSLLTSVKGSVLWLLEDNPTAAVNLRKDAQLRGIDAARLVFAPRARLDEHLARHRVADLFIDTLPYNAHTTASDALWAGLPVLTLMGQSFAARVAASLLNALDLGELITLTQEQYEAKAIELATNPVLLKKIKAKLEQNRLTSPLFNGRLYAKHLDSAYEQIMQRYWQGLGPANLTLRPVDKDPTKLDSIWNEQRGIVRTPTPVVVAAAPQSQTNTTVEGLVGLQTRLEVMDIGAACIAEVPVYRRLMDRGLAHLHAFEGDERQIAKIKQTYGDRVTVYPVFLFDGSKQTVYIAAEASGMTSLLPPRIQAQKFFNGFEKFGHVLSTELLDTHRLDDVPGVPCVDFLKMDIQGAELTVLKNGGSVLQQCVAIQLEVSFVALYESQPTFGEVDVWMRSKGFMPHCFLDVKRWSIAPTIRNNNFRSPFNQLLEADIVYIRDPLTASSWSDEQLRKLILIAHDCFASTDLAIFLLLELERRYPSKAAYKKRKDHYLELVNQKVVK